MKTQKTSATYSSYFKHEFLSRHDDDIRKLFRKHGWYGYGVFWGVLEELYINDNRISKDYEGLAFDLRMDIEILTSVVNDFGLFEVNNKFISSKGVAKRLTEIANKSEKARNSVSVRYEKDSYSQNNERIKSDNERSTNVEKSTTNELRADNERSTLYNITDRIKKIDKINGEKSPTISSKNHPFDLE